MKRLNAKRAAVTQTGIPRPIREDDYEYDCEEENRSPVPRAKGATFLSNVGHLTAPLARHSSRSEIVLVLELVLGL
ncbi:MAG TPA: hypothetical protein VNY04_00710 [Chthoniobacterales bacterium]|nr:hypothetical protein [Chthoniobacterales bacterium]